MQPGMVQRLEINYTCAEEGPPCSHLCKIILASEEHHERIGYLTGPEICVLIDEVAKNVIRCACLSHFDHYRQASPLRDDVSLGDIPLSAEVVLSYFFSEHVFQPS